MHSWEDKRVHAFPMNISQKVIALVCLEFETAYYDVTVQYINLYATGTPHVTTYVNHFTIIIYHSLIIVKTSFE